MSEYTADQFRADLLAETSKAIHPLEVAEQVVSFTGDNLEVETTVNLADGEWCCKMSKTGHTRLDQSLARLCAISTGSVVKRRVNLQ